ncbi:hypothetical protein R3P38DRAFT_3213616 [Favolaschia claudopus]|uniref:Protein kinase domain-containing protein n=1 Tax=Favolaschia claudopus TaxID=2862362 RepID=A0AAW0AEN6_9AGAR
MHATFHRRSGADSTVSAVGAYPRESPRCWSFETEDWATFNDFFLQHNLTLYSSEQFHTAPRPDMTPASSPFHPTDGEDFVFRTAPHPVRTPPNMWRQVIIKAVASGSIEAQVLKCLATSPLRGDPHNHTVPVVSMLHTTNTTFLVHARWGLWWSSTPCTLEFWAGVQAVQLLQGLAFMHENGIVHGDIHPNNVLCNFSEIRTQTPCPVFDKFKSSSSYRIAYIDFGQSMQLPTTPGIKIPCSEYAPPPRFRAPELDGGATYNPFSADVLMMMM